MSDPDLLATALVTLEEARRYIWRDEDDGTRDEILIEAVNDVSEAITTHCEREFKPTAAATRTFAVNANGFVNLAPYDLRTVTTFTLYTDQDIAVQRVLTTSEYRLGPVGSSKAGTYLWAKTIAPTVSEVEPGFGWQATILGDWGMTSVPYAVRLACKQWVENIVKNPGAFASSEMAGYLVVPEVDPAGARPAGMPPAVRRRLEPWKRVVGVS